MTQNSETLKPCPFCGGEAKTTDVYRNREPGTNHFGRRKVSDFIQCKICKAKIGPKKNAHIAWNTRQPADNGAAVEALLNEAIEGLQAIKTRSMNIETARKHAAGVLERVIIKRASLTQPDLAALSPDSEHYDYYEIV